MTTNSKTICVPAEAITIKFRTHEDAEVEYVDDHTLINYVTFECNISGVYITFDVYNRDNDLIEMVNTMSGRVEKPSETCSLYCNLGCNTTSNIDYDNNTKLLTFYGCGGGGESTLSCSFTVRREDIVNELNRKMGLPLVEL
jgi:hypothetical protein